ncbi:hypothetical protein Tco_0841277 [Tanacetum coccineum]|uniref:Uncharacterized protein n=1 Tax=Tanacetum coccineum TaxID=301880 RepID=A0ABQ5AVY0_9ASTR
MTSLAKCSTLRDDVGGWNWLQMMALYCRRSAAMDQDFTARMSNLLQEMVNAYDEKDEKRLHKLRNMESDAGMKADEIEHCVPSKEWDEHKDFTLRASRLVEDMNEAGLDRRDFIWELRCVSCEIVSEKTALFLEHMMEKEGNRKCKLRDLTKEAREMVVEIESFFLKLMDEEPSHMRVFEGNDKQRGAIGERNWLDMMIVYFDDYASEQDFARRLNWLVGEMNEACEGKVAFFQELWNVVGKTVPAKVAVFLEEMMNKEGSREWELCNLEKEAKERVCEIEFFMGKLMCDVIG